MSREATIAVMRETARTLLGGDVRESLVAVQGLRDALDTVMAVLLGELRTSGDFELDGASTVNTWAHNRLRLNSGQAQALLRHTEVLADLLLVGQAASQGRISAKHVEAFRYGLKHVGLEPMLLHQQVLLAVALEHEPAKLFETIRHLQAVTHPDDLDDAYARGMDKEDITVSALPDGFPVTGFLNTVTGAKLKKVLDSVSAPRDKDDQRTGPQRRVQGLDDLLSTILADGLPTDKGIRPHMSVFVDADTMAAAAEHTRQQAEHPFSAADPMPPTEPAVLAGHGPIGPQLLMLLTCLAAITPIVIKNGGGLVQDQILNVGRAAYSPTLRQRQGVIARQKGVCAAPGCSHTHLEIHHSVWWSLGGSTDLDRLIGLCVRCHHLVHRNLLIITGDAVTGWVFTNRHGRPTRKRRQASHQPAA